MQRIYANPDIDAFRGVDVYGQVEWTLEWTSSEEAGISVGCYVGESVAIFTSSLRCNTEVTEGVVDHVHVHPLALGAFKVTRGRLAIGALACDLITVGLTSSGAGLVVLLAVPITGLVTASLFTYVSWSEDSIVRDVLLFRRPKSRKSSRISGAFRGYFWRCDRLPSEVLRLEAAATVHTLDRRPP